MFSFLDVVSNQKEAKDGEVHEDRLGKGKTFTGEAPNALAQCEIESLDMVCFSFCFAARLMLVRR